MRRLVFLPAVVLSMVALLFAAKLDPADVKIEGALDYGQSSDPIDYSGNPPFSAFVFSAKGGDKIEVNVKGSDRKATVAIADGGLNELTSGTTHIAFQVPDNGPDAEAYYIVFRDVEGKPAKLTVELKRVGQAPASHAELNPTPELR